MLLWMQLSFVGKQRGWLLLIVLRRTHSHNSFIYRTTLGLIKIESGIACAQWDCFIFAHGLYCIAKYPPSDTSSFAFTHTWGTMFFTLPAVGVQLRGLI